MVKVGEYVLLAGEKSYVVKVEKGKKFSTQYGEIDLGGLVRKKYGTEVETHLGKKFRVLGVRQPDMLRKVRRAPQVVLAKDAGVIAGKVGLCKEDKVVEAGTGSGYLTIFLAGVASKVYSYEVRQDFYKVAKKNLELCGVGNVVLKNKDVCEGISEKNVDVVVLDMGSPEKAVDEARKCLKPGGFLAVYSPVLEQAGRVVDEMGDGFCFVETIECIERKWDVGENKTRPRTRMLGHTAFLTFGRRA